MSQLKAFIKSFTPYQKWYLGIVLAITVIFVIFFPDYMLEDTSNTLLVVASIVCGDNYFAENIDKCKDFIRAQVEKYQPDLFIAGPAFNAGRFGIACGESCKHRGRCSDHSGCFHGILSF